MGRTPNCPRIDKHDLQVRRRGALIRVLCGELTVDEQLALASAVSEALSGAALALIKDDEIVLDTISGEVSVSDVVKVVRGYVSKRKDSQYYSIESQGEEIVVHSADPLSRSRGRRDSGQRLPPNLLKCPFSGCGFVTPYQELLTVHVRSHGV
jgi:hypothetical protein